MRRARPPRCGVAPPSKSGTATWPPAAPASCKAHQSIRQIRSSFLFRFEWRRLMRSHPAVPPLPAADNQIHPSWYFSHCSSNRDAAQWEMLRRNCQNKNGSKRQEFNLLLAELCALLIPQCLGRIDSGNSQSRHSSSNERYRCEHEDDSKDGGQVIDAYSIDNTVHHTQCSRA